MFQPDLITFARERGLAHTATVLGTFDETIAAAPAGPELTSAPASGFTDLLLQLARRGLEPALVARLRELYAARPLERGLLAWDVLTGSLLAPSDPLIETLRSDARAVATALPAPGARYSPLAGSDAVDLVARVAVPAFTGAPPAERKEGAAQWALGAVELFRGKQTLAPGSAETAVLLAGLLARAHLPTLASFYMGYLRAAFGSFSALEARAEVLLDEQAPELEEASTATRPGDSPEAHSELAGYLAVRLLLNGGLADVVAERSAAFAPELRQSATPPAEQAQHFAGVFLAATDAGLRRRETPVSMEIVSAILQRRPDWRYAARMFVGLTALQSPPTSVAPQQALDKFLVRFGNDAELWRLLITVAPPGAAWLWGCLERLVREASSLPHDLDTWRGVASVFGHYSGAAKALDELTAHVRAQSTL